MKVVIMHTVGKTQTLTPSLLQEILADSGRFGGNCFIVSVYDWFTSSAYRTKLLELVKMHNHIGCSVVALLPDPAPDIELLRPYMESSGEISERSVIHNPLTDSNYVVQPRRKRSCLVQTRNPRTGRYVLLDTHDGEIISHHPRKDTPYKNIVIATK